MGSMMARSTPRVLFHSPVVRHLVTALEILSAFYAIALSITICCLHLRFVRGEGCAEALKHHDTMFKRSTMSQSQSQSRNSQVWQPLPANIVPIIELSILLPASSASNMLPNAKQRFRFSQERGLLLLSDQWLDALNVSVTRVALPTNHQCLGDVISRSILLHLIGYDTVVTNAFARMRCRIQSRDGYVLSIHTRRVLNLLHADPSATASQMPTTTRLVVRFMHKCGAIVTAVFILCTTAALVAFTLREVQVRMIKLTIDLQVMMRSQLGYGRVVIRYATDALVFVPIIAGMLFFLFEFFDDQALAFAVLVITWLCEFAASGSTRHWISRFYLPKLFFCFFVAFHIYFFSFPLGFSWLSFTTSLAWMVHAALAIWNHCELPLLRNEFELQPHWT